MAELLANKIAQKLIAFGAAPQTNYQIIRFGLELMISSLIGILIVAVISTLCGFPFLWILFLAAFIPLRTTAGGYHASTHARCNIVFAVIYLFCVTVCMFVTLSTISYVIISAISAVVVYLFSPVEAINKPLNAERKRNNRMRSIAITLFNLLIAIVLWIIHYNKLLLQMYYLGVFCATLSQLIVIVKNRKEDKANESKD